MVESARLILGFVATYAVFQWSASELGSIRGESGIAIAALVVGATLIVERVAFGRALLPAARSLGLGRPTGPGLPVAVAICGLLLLVPFILRIAGVAMSVTPNWVSFVPGLFAQAGIAEEVLFRGYLFGHLRRSRSFWHATLLSMPPFVVVHLLLFFTMPWPVALAAILLAVIMSPALARLFELGGGTIWPPALLHAVVQGTVKILIVPDENGPWFPILWMAASALLPMLAFLIPQRAASVPPVSVS